MKEDIEALLTHYATVEDGSSALTRETFDEICTRHNVTPDQLCYAIARKVAEDFVAGGLDFDRGDFAINDLFWASECSLKGFALEVFYAFEEGEVMDPRYPSDAIPWKDYTLPSVKGALEKDDAARGPNKSFKGTPLRGAP